MNRESAHTRTGEDGDETALALGCFSNARQRVSFGSDKVDAANAAFRCRRGGMEMQQLGADCDHLRAQPRCPFQLDQLTSSGRPGWSGWCHERTWPAY